MVPEVAQAVGICQGPPAKDYGRVPNPGKTTVTALIANELLYAGVSLTAEAILKNKKTLTPPPPGPLTRPSEQLGYLASVQGLQVTTESGKSGQQAIVHFCRLSVCSRWNTKISLKTTRMSLCHSSTARHSLRSSATGLGRTSSRVMTW